jgi:hypothetical protein
MIDQNPYESPGSSENPDDRREPRSPAAARGEPFAGRLTTVATYYQPLQAELARVRLGDEDIPAFIEGGEFASMAWHLAVANRGIKVQVPSEYVDRAREILSPASTDAERSPEAESDADGDDEAQSEQQLTVREQNADRAFRGAAIGVLFIPLQIYVFWLLMKVLVSDEPLSRPSRHRAIIAAAINIPLMIVLGLFVRSFFRH